MDMTCSLQPSIGIFETVKLLQMCEVEADWATQLKMLANTCLKNLLSTGLNCGRIACTQLHQIKLNFTVRIHLFSCQVILGVHSHYC